MLVLPSFEPEWMITIKPPVDEIAEVEFTTVNKQIWANENIDQVKVIKQTSNIPSSLAIRIQEVCGNAGLKVYQKRR